jgi:hypothetical protein
VWTVLGDSSEAGEPTWPFNHGDVWLSRPASDLLRKKFFGAANQPSRGLPLASFGGRARIRICARTPISTRTEVTDPPREAPPHPTEVTGGTPTPKFSSLYIYFSRRRNAILEYLIMQMDCHCCQ